MTNVDERGSGVANFGERGKLVLRSLSGRQSFGDRDMSGLWSCSNILGGQIVSPVLVMPSSQRVIVEEIRRQVVDSKLFRTWAKIGERHSVSF